MAKKWLPDTVYFCGELHSSSVTKPILVMMVETDLRGGWEEGKRVPISLHEFILTNRQLDGKTQMVTYDLVQVIEPAALEL
jgi:hypothetical protein